MTPVTEVTTDTPASPVGAFLAAFEAEQPASDTSAAPEDALAVPLALVVGPYPDADKMKATTGAQDGLAAVLVLQGAEVNAVVFAATRAASGTVSAETGAGVLERDGTDDPTQDLRSWTAGSAEAEGQEPAGDGPVGDGSAKLAFKELAVVGPASGEPAPGGQASKALGSEGQATINRFGVAVPTDGSSGQRTGAGQTLAEPVSADLQSAAENRKGRLQAPGLQADAELPRNHKADTVHVTVLATVSGDDGLAAPRPVEGPDKPGSTGRRDHAAVLPLNVTPDTRTLPGVEPTTGLAATPVDAVDAPALTDLSLVQVDSAVPDAKSVILSPRQDAETSVGTTIPPAAVDLADGPAKATQASAGFWERAFSALTVPLPSSGEMAGTPRHGMIDASEPPTLVAQEFGAASPVLADLGDEPVRSKRHRDEAATTDSPAEGVRAAVRGPADGMVSTPSVHARVDLQVLQALPSDPEETLVEDSLPSILAPTGALAGASGPSAGVGPAAHLPVPQVAAQMAAALSRSADGSTELALSPDELGHVRLRLEPDAVNPDRMVVMITFERPETLDLFRRHAGELAEALRQAGYAGADIGFGQGDGGSSGFDNASRHGSAPDRADPVPPLIPPAPQHAAGASLDLRL
jgi:hypothetical protein